MSYTLSAPRASFWRESLLALKLTLKAEWCWVLGFAALMSLAQFLAFHNFDLGKLQSQLRDHPKEVAGNMKAMREIWSHFGRAFVLQTAISILASYVFTVLYLQREATSSPPSFAPGNFLYWLGKNCQKYLILFLPMFVLEIIAGVPAAAGVPQASANLIALIFLLIWLAYYVFVMFRLSLVTPLAILRRAPVLKTSWETTRGQCWRIWWGFLVLTLVLLPVFFVPYAAGLIAADLWGAMSVAARALSALAQGVWGGVIAVAGAVYYCTVYRVLLQEQRNSPITIQP